MVKARRIDLRVVAGLLLFGVGTLATSSVIRQAQEKTPVLVADGALQPGHVIEAGDLRAAGLSLAPGVSSVPADRSDALVGTTVARPLVPGQLLHPDDVSHGMPLSPGHVAVSVGVSAPQAAGGQLRPGDLVMVLSTENPDRPEARTTMVLSSVEVLSVSEPADVSAGPELTVTLEVDADDAAAVTQAAHSGAIDLVLYPPGRAP